MELSYKAIYDLTMYSLARFWTFGGQQRKENMFLKLEACLKKVSILPNLDFRKF